MGKKINPRWTKIKVVLLLCSFLLTVSIMISIKDFDFQKNEFLSILSGIPVATDSQITLNLCHKVKKIQTLKGTVLKKELFCAVQIIPRKDQLRGDKTPLNTHPLLVIFKESGKQEYLNVQTIHRHHTYSWKGLRFHSQELNQILSVELTSP